MRRAATALLALIGIVGLAFFAMGFYSQTGKAPGLVAGQLAPCPNKPNCVNSESASSDDHAIAALPIHAGMGDDPVQFAKLKIEEMGGKATVVGTDYLAAEFTSGFFGFVDDLEIRRNADNTALHVRSASRAGYSDWGVNRKRVEALRTKMAEQANKS